MSESTVKPGLTRKPAKRAKHTVENPQFAAFARRILRAYARRIAAGDIEALSSMVLFGAEVDSALREAVRGLHGFGYSWTDIAARLGVSRQAAQMRYGDASERGALDRRLLDAGFGVTLDTLVAVFADHCRGVPAQFVCGGCGHVFDNDDVDGDCPTNTLVRPMLQRRRSERPSALNPLTPVQMDELKAQPRNGNRTRRTTVTAGELFDAAPYRRGPSYDLDPASRRRSR